MCLLRNLILEFVLPKKKTVLQITIFRWLILLPCVWMNYFYSAWLPIVGMQYEYSATMPRPQNISLWLRIVHWRILLSALLITKAIRQPRNLTLTWHDNLKDGEQLAALISTLQREQKMAPISAATATLPKTEASVPSCPVCNSKMVWRTARKGKHTGKQFRGSTGFPKCRGTREYSG